MFGLVLYTTLRSMVIGFTTTAAVCYQRPLLKARSSFLHATTDCKHAAAAAFASREKFPKKGGYHRDQRPCVLHFQIQSCAVETSALLFKMIFRFPTLI